MGFVPYAVVVSDTLTFVDHALSTTVCVFFLWCVGLLSLLIKLMWW